MEMNGTKRLIAAMVCGLVLGAAPVFAQENGTAPGATQDQTAPMHHGEGHGDREEHRVEHMSKALNLTPDQVTQVKAIDASAHDQMRALHEDTTTAPADKRAKRMAIHQDSMAKVRALLTDEQKAKLDAMQARMKEHRDEHQGEHQGEQGHPTAPPAQ